MSEIPAPVDVVGEDDTVYVEKANTTNYKAAFVILLLIGPAIIGTYLVTQWLDEAVTGVKTPHLGTILAILVFGVAAAVIALQQIEKHFTRKILGIQRAYIDAVYTPPMDVAYDLSGSKETDYDIEDLVTYKWFGLYLDKCKFIDVDDATVKKVLEGASTIVDPKTGAKKLDKDVETALEKALDLSKTSTVPPDDRKHYAYSMLLDRPMYYKNVLGEVKQIIDPVVIFPAPIDECIKRRPGNVPANGFRYDHPDTDHLVLVYQVTVLGDLPVYWAAFSSYNRDQVVQPAKLTQELATNVAMKVLTFLYGEKDAMLNPINQMRIKAEARTSATRSANVATAVKDLPAPPADTAARDAFNRYKARWGPRGSEIPVYWFVTIAITAMFILKLFGVY